ncbi:putative neuropeptide precursor protein isoform X1 [Vanessa cardui]|uniref:putative neuropeptide precursor protein isoform X1 n=1 Tax=Vanessa cardui TaxID=171605 RepID=UPI001F12C35A|nr:putative neuropeptide precursor protein isoform X1 [Vanessa cardui]
MLLISLTAVFAVLVVNNAEPVPNTKDDGPIAELPENWDQTKDDTQSLFLNKSDKNDLEPYPLALSEEGNSEGYEQAVEQRYESPQSNGELDNLIMRPELYGEPPAMEGLSGGYESRRRKRGSGKVGGAGAATKVATKSGSGKKNLKVNDAPMPVDFVMQENDNNRRKRGSGTKVGGAAASAKTATKNSGGNKKNFRSVSERRKRDSGLSAADVRALLNFWEAQERRKQDLHAASRNAEIPYYGNVNTLDLGQPEVDEVGDIWLRDDGAIDPRERDYPRQSYFSEQNRVGLPMGLPEIYPVDPNELMQRYEEARRKRMYVNKMKRFMVARKRSDMHQNNYRPRDDLYTLAELLRSAPRVQEQDIPVYRRLIL